MDLVTDTHYTEIQDSTLSPDFTVSASQPSTEPPDALISPVTPESPVAVKTMSKTAPQEFQEQVSLEMPESPTTPPDAMASLPQDIPTSVAPPTLQTTISIHQPPTPPVSPEEALMTRLPILTDVTLVGSIYPKTQWIIPGFLSEGLTMMVAKPKVGKTTLAKYLAHSIASNQAVFGSIVPLDCEVLYLSLEETPSKMQESRLNALQEGKPSAKFHHCFDLNSLEEIPARIKALNNALKCNPKIKMVVIDTMGRFFDCLSKKRDNYADSYRRACEIKAIADRHHVAILVLHHQRKGKSENDLDCQSAFKNDPQKASKFDPPLVKKYSS